MVDIGVQRAVSLRCHREDVTGFRDLYVDLAVLRDAVSLPPQGAVHPTRAAARLGLKVDTVFVMLKRRRLDQVPVKRPASARPALYVDPSSVEAFPAMYVSLRELARRKLAPDKLTPVHEMMEQYRLDLGPKAEPIYHRNAVHPL